MSELQIEVEGDEIIVRRPRTAFSAVYQKPDHLPHLLMVRGSSERDAPVRAIYEFRAAAFQAAVAKARELGWLV